MSDPVASPSLTRDQAVLIASRLFACYLLLWALSDLIDLPREVLSLAHEMLGPEGFGFTLRSALHVSYYVRMSILYLAAHTLRIALWLVAFGWFYRCGPRIRNFFAAEDQSLIASDDTPLPQR
jgi:hypothetical protein